MQPLISTLTSCYRMKAYLKTFLQELPKQTYFKYLEVVLDHHEPDDQELAWVDNFQKQYPGHIKYIIHKQVTSLGKSWNRCIKESSGKHLTIWNIDDLRTENSLELQANLLEKNDVIDIVYGNYTVVDSFGKTSGNFIEHEHIPKSEFTRSMIWGPFFMFRKSLMRKVGHFDEQLTSGLDFDFAIRAALHGKTSIIKENLGYYLNAQSGLSTRPNSLQPIERTVVELRYGIYDKIDYRYLPQATQYTITFLKFHDTSFHVSQFVPNYTQWLEKRMLAWHRTGLQKNLLQTKRKIRKQIFHKLKLFLPNSIWSKKRENNCSSSR